LTTSKESDSLKALLSIASPPLGQQLVELPREFGHGGGSTEKDLAELLEQRNGFLAFEGALHVFPLGPGAEGYELMAWNSQELWRFAYDDMASDHLFFAEDVFGEQFSIRADRIWRFNPETGDSEDVAASLEHWAQGILQNYEVETGHKLAHAWQERHGPLPIRERLVPKIPFVAGGQFDVDNLSSVDAAEGMRYRGHIATQIRDLPNGAQIRLAVTE